MEVIMERIRDFLYDISDLLISLLIIAAIFTVISWKLNESIPIDSSLVSQSAEEPATPESPAAEETPTQTEDPDTAAEPDVEPVADASDADKPISGETTPKPVTPAATPPAEGKAVTIEIPSGSPGIAIGRILKEQGLITDVNAFIQKVDAMGMGPKLRSGTFQLKTGMSLEQIIKTLANVN